MSCLLTIQKPPMLTRVGTHFESMKTPVVLILGGTDKGNDYNEIKAW